MESYRRTRSEERETILVLVEDGKNQADIAKALGRNQSSLSRELAKGLEKGAYNAFLAQRDIEKRAAYRKSLLKIDAQTWEVIKNHLSLH
jgi:IS30 family transposase